MKIKPSKALKKKHISLFLILIMIFSINSCSKEADSNVLNQTDGDLYDYCNAETTFTMELTNRCQIETDFTPSMNDAICRTFKHDDKVVIGSYDSHKKCIENLASLSCSALESLKTEEDLKNIEGCLDFQKLNKKEVCVKNHILRCGQINFICQDDSKSPENCYKTGDYIDGWGDTISSFDEDKIKEYCSTTINGDEKISETGDFLDEICRRSDNIIVDCDNIQELDFRNDDWKELCVQE